MLATTNPPISVSELRVGDRVVFRDSSGPHCIGTITSLANEHVTVRLGVKAIRIRRGSVLAVEARKPALI